MSVYILLRKVRGNEWDEEQRKVDMDMWGVGNTSVGNKCANTTNMYNIYVYEILLLFSFVYVRIQK